MSHNGAGTGIKKVSDIMDRCKINEAGCWVWAWCVSQGSARANIGGKNKTVPGILYSLRYGERVPNGMRYHAYCGDRLCMRHRKLVSISEAVAAAPARDMLKKRMAIKATKALKSNIPQEAVDRIRAAGKGNVERTARELGICLGTARAIACGDSRAPIGSSVFEWRPE